MAELRALLATAVCEPLPLYVWNASESVPIGLYRLRPADNLFVTELVAVQPPEPLATFLDLNGYLPVGIPMLKRVLALPGQTVCRSGLTISVDDDRHGRGAGSRQPRPPLPEWQGCRVVGEGELFLMNWQSEDSLDGRYFGFLPASAVIGRALPVWTGRSDRACHRVSDLPFLCSTECGTIPPSRPRLRRRRAQRRSRAAERPARSGFTLDGREHGGMLASFGRSLCAVVTVFVVLIVCNLLLPPRRDPADHPATYRD